MTNTRTARPIPPPDDDDEQSYSGLLTEDD